MQDIGVIGMVLPEYDPDRCIGCEACVKNCRKVASGALSMVNYKVKRDHQRCLGCGECILKCPASAWTRGDRYYRLVIMGRSDSNAVISENLSIDARTLARLLKVVHLTVFSYRTSTFSAV